MQGTVLVSDVPCVSQEMPCVTRGVFALRIQLHCVKPYARQMPEYIWCGLGVTYNVTGI